MTLDGEAVSCGANGVSDFEKLHSQTHNDSVSLYAFDLLQLNGDDLRSEPLVGSKSKIPPAPPRPAARSQPPGRANYLAAYKAWIETATSLPARCFGPSPRASA